MQVNAKKRAIGWDLVLADGRTTQVRTLDKAKKQVLAYLDEQEPGVDHSEMTDIVIVWELGDVLVRAQEARVASAAAQAATIESARMVRAVVRDFQELGLSVTDIAHILGVTRGRVSQIGERARYAEKARRHRGE